jgi:hypothetical protein
MGWFDSLKNAGDSGEFQDINRVIQHAVKQARMAVDDNDILNDEEAFENIESIGEGIFQSTDFSRTNFEKLWMAVFTESIFTVVRMNTSDEDREEFENED